MYLRLSRATNYIAPRWRLCGFEDVVVLDLATSVLFLVCYVLNYNSLF